MDHGLGINRVVEYLAVNFSPCDTLPVSADG